MSTRESSQKEVASNESQENSAFNGCRAERICSRARLELSRRGCRVVKPVAGEVVVIPFPRPDPVFVRNLLLREISIHVLLSIPGSVDRSGADRTLDRAGAAQE